MTKVFKPWIGTFDRPQTPVVNGGVIEMCSLVEFPARVYKELLDVDAYDLWQMKSLQEDVFTCVPLLLHLVDDETWICFLGKRHLKAVTKLGKKLKLTGTPKEKHIKSIIMFLYTLINRRVKSEVISELSEKFNYPELSRKTFTKVLNETSGEALQVVYLHVLRVHVLGYFNSRYGDHYGFVSKVFPSIDTGVQNEEQLDKNDKGVNNVKNQ